MADRGVELRLIAKQGEWNISRANHGERNIALELGQWDSCGIWSSGPMPKPGTSTIHPFALDGRMENRGAASYNKPFQIPLNEEFIDECCMREYGNWLRERMQIYPSGVALAAHMPDLIPEHAVHALIECFAETVTNPEKVTENIAQCARRLPPQETMFWRTKHLSPGPGCLEALANSIIWDPCGMQWGRNGHFPLLAAYGTKRYRIEECSSGALPLPKPKQKTKNRSKGWQEEGVEHVALAADAPQEAPDTGGASGSADVPPYLLPNVQAARLWNQASSVGHTA